MLSALALKEKSLERPLAMSPSKSTVVLFIVLWRRSVCKAVNIENRCQAHYFMKLILDLHGRFVFHGTSRKRIGMELDVSDDSLTEWHTIVPHGV